MSFKLSSPLFVLSFLISVNAFAMNKDYSAKLSSEYYVAYWLRGHSLNDDALTREKYSNLFPSTRKTNGLSQQDIEHIQCLSLKAHGSTDCQHLEHVLQRIISAGNFAKIVEPATVSALDCARK